MAPKMARPHQHGVAAFASLWHLRRPFTSLSMRGTLAKRCWRLCGQWRQRVGSASGDVLSKRSSDLRGWTRWTFELWYVVDLRTVALVWVAQCCLIIATLCVGVVHITNQKVGYSAYLLAGQAVYRFGTQMLSCIGAGLFVRRAVRNESHSDLVAAAALNTLLGVVLLLESTLLQNGPTTIPIPLWASITCACLTAFFVYLCACLFGRFGWRQLMRFGSEPEKRVLYDRLERQDTLLTSDMLCLMFLGLATVRAMLEAAERQTLDDPRLYVSIGAWVFGWFYDAALDWLTMKEKRFLTLVCALVGCIPRGWFLYTAIILLSDAFDVPPLPSNVSDANIDQVMASTQLGIAVVATIVRLAVAASSVVVALTVYGHGVKLFGDEKHLFKRLWAAATDKVSSAAEKALQLEEEEMLPDAKWRSLPVEARRAVEKVIQGEALDLVFETDEDDSLETDEVDVDSDRAASARAFVQYSLELETLRWSWTGYIGIDQFIDVSLKIRDAPADGIDEATRAVEEAVEEAAKSVEQAAAKVPKVVANATRAACSVAETMSRTASATLSHLRASSSKREEPDEEVGAAGVNDDDDDDDDAEEQSGLLQLDCQRPASPLRSPTLRRLVRSATSNLEQSVRDMEMLRKQAVRARVRQAAQQLGNRDVILQIRCHSSLRGRKHKADGRSMRKQTLLLSSKNRETLLYWYWGLRVLLREYHGRRQLITLLQAKWMRHVFEWHSGD